MYNLTSSLEGQSHHCALRAPEHGWLISCICIVSTITQDEPGLESCIREMSSTNANSRISVPLQSISFAVCLPSSALVQVMGTFLSNFPILSINQAWIHVSD